MSYTVIWTSEALATFEDRIAYLNIHWTDKEITNFKSRVKEYLNTLSETPFIGKKPGKLKDVYMGLIIRQVSIIYRIKRGSSQIELISFIDNRQNPRKNRRYFSKR
jgi:plasmid stabilization system protein ParE